MPQTITIKVISKAKINKVESKNDIFRVYTTELPIRGKANKAVIQLLAKEFGVAKSLIRIIKGETSREKIIELPNNSIALQKTLI